MIINVSEKAENDFSGLPQWDFLPQKLKNFLEETNGGIVVEDSIPFWHIEHTDIECKPVCFFGKSDSEKDIATINSNLADELPENSFVFAKDKYDNYFVILVQDDGIYLCYWDYNKVLPISSNDSNAYILSHDFDYAWDELGEIIIKKHEEEEELMDKRDYLPLGSIVVLKGGIVKVLVTSRGLLVNHNGDTEFFDYAGVSYPRGLVDDKVLYFNIDSIGRVVFKGFSDEDDKTVVGNINDYINDHPDLVWGNPSDWNAE